MFVLCSFVEINLMFALLKWLFIDLQFIDIINIFVLMIQ